MTNGPDALRFQYSGFLQNVQIHLQGEDTSAGYKVTCTANLKLPVLKKKFLTWTLFKDSNLNWLEHSTVVEEGKPEKRVVRSNFSADAVDPIGFFLMIDRKQWSNDTVKLVIGSKEVALDVIYEKDSVTVARPEKNQKLVMRLGRRGIETLEVPVPVIGNLRIERVD